MKQPGIALLAAASALVLALTGCSASSTGERASGNGTLVFATGEPDHLTPGRQTVAFDQVRSIFAPLVALDDKNDVTYVQAKSVTSDDAQHWTITLRDGWTFQNGEPVTAKSYVDAWNHTAYGPNAWENSGQLAGIQGYGDLNPAEGGTPTAETMSGLAVVDDLTFTVALTAPDSQFPLQLGPGQTAFYPMPESAYTDLDAYDRKPVGNGPFEMTSAWKDNQEFTVEAYKDYAGAAPKVHAVTFRSYTDQATGYTDVLAGNADIIMLPTNKMTSASADFGDRLHSFQAPGVDFIGFPPADARYQNPDVRKAISMAIDRDAVNKAIYGGLYQPATALTAPSMAGTPEDACGDSCTFDPTAAKTLLAKAGGFSGSMELVFPGGIGLDSLYEAYANQIRQNLGIADVTAKPSTDWAEYYDSLVAGTVQGPHFGHWGALYASQQNTLRALFTPTGNCQICTGYSNPAVDALLHQADAAATLDDSYALYAEAQKVILADFPTVPTFSNTYSYVTSDRVKDLPAVSGTVIIPEVALQG